MNGVNFSALDGNSRMLKYSQQIAAATLFPTLVQKRVVLGGCSRGVSCGGPSHARNSPRRNVIVLGAIATILLCPPLSPATIKRTPRRQAALRRQSVSLWKQ